MATEVNYGDDGELFVGEDKTLKLHVKDGATPAVPVDIAGWTILWIVRRTNKGTGTAVLTKTATITGTYNVAPLVNTQRAVVTLTDDELATLTSGGLYFHSWKRNESGVETILARGRIHPERATQE